jgi:hypothetical protein
MAKAGLLVGLYDIQQSKEQFNRSQTGNIIGRRVADCCQQIILLRLLRARDMIGTK